VNTVLETSLDAFDRDVVEASYRIPVLVDFWAEWCSPCLVIAPVLEQLGEEMRGNLRLVKLEVDAGENMKLAGHYRVRGFPTLILFDAGNEVGRFSGARPKRWIAGFLRQHLDLP
jgi:putative thioredoxin